MSATFTRLRNTLLLAVIELLYCTSAQAQVTNSDIYENVLDRFRTATAAWGGVITGHATWLFWTLVVISMVWTFGFMALRKADLGEFFAELIRFTVFVGFFWWLLQNGPAFGRAIIDSMRNIGGEATGLGPGLRPGNIVDIGFDIFFRTLTGISVWAPLAGAANLVLAVLCLFFLAFIATNMLVLLVSAWVLLYAGIFFLGFGGSRWTSDMAINYYKTVLAIGASLFGMVLIVGIGTSVVDQYYTNLSEGIQTQELIVIAVVCFIMVLLTDKVPALLAGIVNGTSVGQAGHTPMSSGAMMAGAAMASAAVATAGAAAVAGATQAAGGAQAVMAAVRQGMDNVAAGTDIMSRMSASGSGAPAAGSDSPLGHAMGGSSGSSSGVMGAISKAGRVAADAGANLASGAATVVKGKATEAKETIAERIGQTVGGQVATAISAQGHDDSLSAPTADEVAAFANKGNA